MDLVSVYKYLERKGGEAWSFNSVARKYREGGRCGRSFAMLSSFAWCGMIVVISGDRILV